MKEIAELINLVATDFENSKEEVSKSVNKICEKHPLYN